ncbi:MAG: 4Fe-4S dicluster domain-containing protein [bacterium]
MKIRSDPALLAEVRKYGNFDTNACFQCGSCTVICNLTNNSASFPRRIFRYALLGLRKPLLNSLDPWLCYYCGDCSTTCPRQAEPAESMMTLRRYLAVQYDWTGISSKIYKSKAWEIGALTITAILVLLLALIYHLNIVGLKFSEFAIEPAPMGMEHMFNTITVFTLSIFAICLFFLISNAVRMFWYTVHKDNKVHIPVLLYLTEAKTFISHAITQKQFRECTDKSRWIKHLLLVSGCVIMFFLLVFFLKWFQTDNLYPVYHPQRWLGYLAAGALIFATLEILIGRVRKREQIHKFSDPTDWILPVMLLLTAVSGIAVHIFRYLEFSLVAHFTYALHLAIAVPMIVIELPFGKWTHTIYRPLAIYFQTVKEKALQKQAKKELILENAG